MEVPKKLKPDLPFTIQTRQSDRTRLTKKYNSDVDDFVVDRIDLKKIVEELVGLEEITVSQDIDIVDDRDEEWIDDRSKSEVEFDDEEQQSYEQDLTNLRVVEWLTEMTSDPKETSVTIQDVDRESKKYKKTKGMILPGLLPGLLSLPVYDQNRGRLHPRLYALIHVIFSDTNIQVYLHKKYYLSIG